MYIRGKGEVFLVDRDNSVFSCSSLSFPARAEEEHLVDTLLDGVSRTNCMMSSSAILSGQELVEDKLPNGVRPRYLVYDIMPLSGKRDIYGVTMLPDCSASIVRSFFPGTEQ